MSGNNNKDYLGNEVNEPDAWGRAKGDRSLTQLASAAGESIGAEGIVWTVDIEINNTPIKALIDSGASRSFIAPELVKELSLERKALQRGLSFQEINGEPFKLKECVKGVKWCVNEYVCS